MENLNYNAVLDISNVLSNMQKMEEVVKIGSSSISKTISNINVTFLNMSSELSLNSSQMTNDISKITESAANSVKIVQSMKDTISSLSKHSDTIKQLSSSFIDTTNFIDDYTKKIVDANIQNGGFTDGFSFLGMALQDVTKNMDLASVSMSLIDFAIEGFNNPIGFAIELVGNLALGLGTLSLMGDKNYQTLEKNKKIVEDHAVAIQQDIESSNLLQEQYDKQISSNLALVDNTKRLFDQLTTVVSVNGEVKDGFEGTAKFILGELNSAFGTNYQIVDGVIQGYDELYSTIGSSVDKMKADAILEIQKKQYVEALSSLEEYSNKVLIQENELVRIKEENGKVIQESEDAIAKAIATGHEELVDGYKKDIEAAKQKIAEQEANVEAEKELVKGKLDTIALYEDNAAAYAEQRYEDIKTKRESDMADDTAAQLEAYQNRYDSLRIKRDIYLAEGDEKRAAQMQKEMDDELVNAQSMLEAKGINNDNELIALQSYIDNKQARLTEMYATDEAQWTEEQQKEAEALKSSISNNLDTYSQYATDKVNKAVELTTALGDNATEEQKNAAAAARQEATDTLQILEQNALEKLRILEDLKTRRANNEAGVTDQMVTEAERQAVEAESKYGEVATKISESWEDLPGESQETFQNVMNPMLEEMEKKEPALFSKANGIAGGILERLKTAFDINSPSKKVKKIFQSVMEGAEVGLDDKKPKLLNQITEIATDVIHKFSNLDDMNVDGAIAKMKSAVLQEQYQMATTMDSAVRHELHVPNNIRVEIPELKGTIHGNIENHLEIDGRETAIQLTPFISEELAFSSHF